MLEDAIWAVNAKPKANFTNEVHIFEDEGQKLVCVEKMFRSRDRRRRTEKVILRRVEVECL